MRGVVLRRGCPLSRFTAAACVLSPLLPPLLPPLLGLNTCPRQGCRTSAHHHHTCNMPSAVLVGVLGLAEALPQTAGAVVTRVLSWACVLLGVTGERPPGKACGKAAGAVLVLLHQAWRAASVLLALPASVCRRASPTPEAKDSAAHNQPYCRWHPPLETSSDDCPAPLQCLPMVLVAPASWRRWCCPSCRTLCGRCCPLGTLAPVLPGTLPGTRQRATLVHPLPSCLRFVVSRCPLRCSRHRV